MPNFRITGNSARAVNRLRQPIMLGDHVALAMQTGRRQHDAGGQRPGLLENPRIADRPAGDRNAVDARLAEHVETIAGREQVAAAEHGPLAGVLLHFAEKLARAAPS